MSTGNRLKTNRLTHVDHCTCSEAHMLRDESLAISYACALRVNKAALCVSDAGSC